MSPEQFERGMHNYCCGISHDLELDAVRLARHPIPNLQKLVYGRANIEQWLASKQICPYSNEELGYYPRMEACTLELTLFALASSQALEAGCFKLNTSLSQDIPRKIEKYVRPFLDKVQQQQPELYEQAVKTLKDLRNDNRVDVPIKILGRLASCGVNLDYHTQEISAEHTAEQIRHASRRWHNRLMRWGMALGAALIGVYTSYRLWGSTEGYQPITNDELAMRHSQNYALSLEAARAAQAWSGAPHSARALEPASEGQVRRFLIQSGRHASLEDFTQNQIQLKHATQNSRFRAGSLSL